MLFPPPPPPLPPPPPPPLLLLLLLLLLPFPCLLTCTMTWLEHITLWKLTVQRTSIVCDKLSSLNVVLHLVCGLRYAIDHTQETAQSQGSVLNSCHNARLCLIYSRIDRASVCRGFFTFCLQRVLYRLSAEGSLPSSGSKTNGR